MNTSNVVESTTKTAAAVLENPIVSYAIKIV
jgi:hypothetical protein